MSRGRAAWRFVRRWWAALLVAFLGLLSLVRTVDLTTLPFAPDATWARVQRQGVLRVGTDASYPPLASLTPEAAFVGLDIELAQAIADGLGVSLELANIHYDGLLGALQAGRIDMIISAVPYDGTLTRDVAFSRSYADLGLVLVTRSGAGAPIDLADSSVVVELGSEAHLYARRLDRGQGSLRIVVVDRVEELVAPLVQGEVDAAICDRITGGQLAAGEALQMVLPPLVSEPVHVVTARGAPRLAAEVNSIITTLQTSGRLQQMDDRWLGGDR